MSGVMIIDHFSGGLDEMPRKAQRDIGTVLKKLATMERFSIFDVTANITIAATMQRIRDRGYIEITGGAFPWNTFKITPSGQAIIDAGSQAMGKEAGK